MFNYEDENYKQLRTRIKENPKNFIFILGSGVSKNAGLPMWGELYKLLKERRITLITDEDEKKAEEARLDKIESYWDKFGHLKKTLPAAEYNNIISHNLSTKGKKTPIVYEQIWELDINGVITFNIDRFVLDAYAAVRHLSVDSATGIDIHKYSTILDPNNPFVFFPHGEHGNNESWVFTSKEKSKLYRDEQFKNVMSNLLNSRSIVIIGFNPLEVNFLNVLNEIGINGSLSGFDNYYIGPDIDEQTSEKLGDYGILTISYTPSNETHPEIQNLLDDILRFVPKDIDYPTVYRGAKYTEKDIPNTLHMMDKGIDYLRNVLNGNIANIIPVDRVPTDKQVQELSDFYKKYQYQIVLAWHIDSKKKIYNYNIIDTVERGSFGSVYAVEDEKNNRYALKVLLENVRDQRDYLNCFRRGIRSMNILTRHNVEGMVKIYESYEIPACIIMDYIDGYTLRTAVDNRALTTLYKKIEVLLKISKIIKTAHDLPEGILHRDLKPENIILKNFYSENNDDHTDVYILDFDLSWHVGSNEQTVSLTGLSQGFMAPEQVDSSSLYKRRVSVDIYGIGMLIYYVLTTINPLPYLARMRHYRDNMLESLNHLYHFKWECIKHLIVTTVDNCICEDPLKRTSLEAVINNLELILGMEKSNKLYNNTLFIRELAYRLTDSLANVEIQDFERRAIVKRETIGKSIILQIAQNKREVVLQVKIRKQRMSSDNRNYKVYEKAKDRALAKVDSKIFDKKSSDIEMSAVVITVEKKIEEVFTDSDVTKITKAIEVISKELEF